MLYKIDILKNSAIFTQKHHCDGVYFKFILKFILSLFYRCLPEDCFCSTSFDILFMGMCNDQVYSDTQVPTQVNTRPTRIKASQHKSDTSQHESDTNQHESTRVQHKSTQVLHESTRVNTSPTRVSTNCKSTRVQHESTRVEKSSRRVTTSQQKSDMSLTRI